MTGAVAGLGAAFLVSVVSAGADASSTPMAAGALLLVAELGHWSLELRRGARPSPQVVARRVVLLVLLALAAVLAGALVLAAADAPVRKGLGTEVVGVAGALGTLALLAALARLAGRS